MIDARLLHGGALEGLLERAELLQGGARLLPALALVELLQLVLAAPQAGRELAEAVVGHALQAGDEQGLAVTDAGARDAHVRHEALVLLLARDALLHRRDRRGWALVVV